MKIPKIKLEGFSESAKLPLTIDFIEDETGTLTDVRITAPVPPGISAPIIHATTGVASISVSPAFAQLEDKMLAELKILESALAFCCSLSRIRWHACVQEFIPEPHDQFSRRHGDEHSHKALFR